VVIQEGEHLSTFDKNSLNFNLYIFIRTKKCVKLDFEVACIQEILAAVFLLGSH